MCGDGCRETRKGKEAKLHVADMDVRSYKKGTGNMYLTDKRKHTGRSNKRENQGIALQMVWVHNQKKIILAQSIECYKFKKPEKDRSFRNLKVVMKGMIELGRSA